MSETSGADQPYIHLKPLHLEPGLYVTATPIGNLGDITVRALQVLAGVERIACEDTRMTRRLLDRYGIETPLISFHEHNAHKQRPVLLNFLGAGERIALVSDAGTPLISDPGFSLIREAADNSYKIIPIPGACAAITALSAAGLPTDAFQFVGFLPPKEKGRRDRLEHLKTVDATLVVYETANRLKALCQSIQDVMGPQTPLVLARELTKQFEEFRRLPVDQLLRDLDEAPVKGECVLLVDPRAVKPALLNDQELDELILSRLHSGGLAKELSVQLAQETGRKKRDIYQRILALKSE